MPTLRSRADLARVSGQGRSRADRLLVVRYVPNALDHDRFAISTGRRLGRAVQRNRIRRRLREIVRDAPNQTGEGWDLLIVARPPAADATFAELRAALVRLLSEIRGPVRPSP